MHLWINKKTQQNVDAFIDAVWFSIYNIYNKHTP